MPQLELTTQRLKIKRMIATRLLAGLEVHLEQLVGTLLKVKARLDREVDGAP